jgi:hypothetical protein
LLPAGLEAVSTAQLNETSDAVLLQLVSKAAGEAGDAALQVSTPLATFCTVGLISRVYDIIAKREPGCRHVLLAKVVYDVMGSLFRAPEDVAFIGNDAWMQMNDALYVRSQLIRARGADRTARSRNKVRGTLLPPSKEAVLLQLYYRPFDGGVLPDGTVVAGREVPTAVSIELDKCMATAGGLAVDLKRSREAEATSASGIRNLERDLDQIVYTAADAGARVAKRAALAEEQRDAASASAADMARDGKAEKLRALAVVKTAASKVADAASKVADAEETARRALRQAEVANAAKERAATAAAKAEKRVQASKEQAEREKTEQERLRQLKKAMAAKHRGAADVLDESERRRAEEKEVSQKRLTATKSLTEQNSALKAENEELHEHLRGMREGKLHEMHVAALTKLESMPTWRGKRAAGRN